MTIYEIEAESNNGNFTYATLVFSNDLNETDNDCSFKGIRQGTEWISPEFEWQFDDTSGKAREKANFSHVFAGGINIAADQTAKEALSLEFGEDIEFLPMNIKDENEDWFLINIVNDIPEALSLEHSKFKMRSNGTFGRLLKAVFDSSKIPEDRPFVYPQWVNAFMFKGEKLKTVLSEKKMTGVTLDEHESV